MSGLKATYPVALSFGSTSQVAVFRVAAPTNQKVWVRVTPRLLGTGSGAFGKIELRRGTSGGTLSAAVTWVKVNGQDAETVQGAGYTYSVQPTNNGSVVKVANVKDDRFETLAPVLINGGETLDVWFTPLNSAMTGTLEVEIEQ